MAVYTQLTNETIAALIEGEYGLGKLLFALGIAEGVENTNYLVGVAGRTGEEKYILTLYEKRVAPEELPFFLGLMRHLAAVGFACPQPVSRRDGGLSGEVAGRRAVLVSFLPGKSKTVFGIADIEAVGAQAATLHAAARGFALGRANALSLAGWQRLAAKIAGKLDTVEQGLAALVADELSYLEKHWPKPGSLPGGVIHADIFPDNVFFEEGRITGVIDFYFACNDFLAYEVAIILNAWCFDGATLNEEKARALRASYEQARPFTKAENDAWKVLLRGAALRFLLTRAHDLIHHDAGALVTPHDPLEYVRKLRYHREHA